jgi:diguanylate cyclase (GGDEF)-like protein
MVDLDYFKQFNDKFGHDVGDDVLQRFSKELKKSIHKKDAILRYGGEEFILLLFGATKHGLEIYEEIDKRLSDLPIETGRGKTTKINFSAGATIIPWSKVSQIAEASPGNLNSTIGSVFKPADTALRSAKELGRGRLVFSEQ